MIIYVVALIEEGKVLPLGGFDNLPDAQQEKSERQVGDDEVVIYEDRVKVVGK